MLEFLKKLFVSKKEDTGVYIPPSYVAPKKSKSTSIDELMSVESPVFIEETKGNFDKNIDALFEEQKKGTIKPKSNYTIEEEWEIFEEDDLYGYKDENGDKVIPAKFKGAESFRNGYAIVDVKKGTGMINRKGEFILDPIYDYVIEEKNGFLQIEKDSKYGFAKPDGSIAIPVQYEDTGIFSEGLVWVEKDSMSGYVDANNTLIIPFKFDWCGNFSEGLASATQYAAEEGQKDHFGYIDKTGNFVIEVEDYDEAGDFVDGLAPLSINDKFGFINKQGKFICEPIYANAGNFVQGLSCVQLEDGGKWGYADKTGKLVIPYQFDSTSDYIDDQDELNEFISGLKKKYLKK